MKKQQSSSSGAAGVSNDGEAGGAHAAAAAATTGQVLKGLACSTGTGVPVRGACRVCRTLADATEVRPGEVLVVQSTGPAWTSLFAYVGAVVMETGGTLSHGAVVAREYEVPAVSGIANATALLRTGQIVEVDGNDGVVRVLLGGSAAAAASAE